MLPLCVKHSTYIKCEVLLQAELQSLNVTVKERRQQNVSVGKERIGMTLSTLNDT